MCHPHATIDHNTIQAATFTQQESRKWSQYPEAVQTTKDQQLRAQHYPIFQCWCNHANEGCTPSCGERQSQKASQDNRTCFPLLRASIATILVLKNWIIKLPNTNAIYIYINTNTIYIFILINTMLKVSTRFRRVISRGTWWVTIWYRKLDQLGPWPDPAGSF